MKIREIEAGGAAEKAKLRAGDEILSINGHEIHDVIDLRYYSYESRLKLRILRDGKERTVRMRKPESDEIGRAHV